MENFTEALEQQLKFFNKASTRIIAWRRCSFVFFESYLDKILSWVCYYFFYAVARVYLGIRILSRKTLSIEYSFHSIKQRHYSQKTHKSVVECRLQTKNQWICSIINVYLHSIKVVWSRCTIIARRCLRTEKSCRQELWLTRSFTKSIEAEKAHVWPRNLQRRICRERLFQGYYLSTSQIIRQFQTYRQNSDDQTFCHYYWIETQSKHFLV